MTTTEAPKFPAPAALETSRAAAEHDLASLTAGLRKLERLAPLERARSAKVLLVAAQRILADVNRQAVYDATRSLRYDVVAAELGITNAAINRTVQQYNKARPEVAQ
jgi:HAMP domain-containing protein